MAVSPASTALRGPIGGKKATDLEVGDVVLARPGERIAADGAVVAGASEVDQATITGEPLPVDKTVGDEVFADTLNGIGALRVRVDRRAEDSVVARIATLVERASPDQGPHPVVHREDRTAPRSLRRPKTSSQAGIFQAGPDRISASNRHYFFRCRTLLLVRETGSL